MNSYILKILLKLILVEQYHLDCLYVFFKENLPYCQVSSKQKDKNNPIIKQKCVLTSHLGADAWKNRLDCGLGLPPGWNPGAQHCLPPAAVEYLVGQTLAFYI